MRWGIALLLAAGCGFQLGGSAPRDAGDDDATDAAPDAIDAPVDMAPDMMVDMMIEPPDADFDGVLDDDDNCPAVGNAAQENFDGDSTGDACDVCPQFAGPASGVEPDGDSDGIGDSCDPRPGQSGDTRLVWQPLYDATSIAGWVESNNGAGTWAIANQRLVQSDPAPALALFDTPQTYGNVFWQSEIVLHGPLDANDEIGVCGGHIPVGVQYYCCAINDESVRVTNVWQGSGFIRSNDAGWSPPQVMGASIAIEGRMNATDVGCTFRQGATTVTPTPEARGPDVLGSVVLYTANMPGTWRYLFVVAIGS